MENEQDRIHGIKYGKRYPLLDSETHEPVSGLEKVYFDAEIYYRTLGEKKTAVPMDVKGLRQIFAEYHSPMSENVAKDWIYGRLQNPLSIVYMHLDELILGDEGDQEVHTLKAKGRTYCRK